MGAIYPDIRESGISLIGNVPWGTRLCQFYGTAQDLLDILVPYLRAGLENNEFCLWIVSDPLSAESARKAMGESVPDFALYGRKNQIEIAPSGLWEGCGGDGEKALVSRLDQAILAGFDGLRFALNVQAGMSEGDIFGENADVFVRYNMITLFAYPREQFGAVSLMDVVKKHRFALVRNANIWEVMESSEVWAAKDALRRSEERFRSLFANMSEGFAYHRIVLDEEGRPSDYIFLETNDSFERLTGLKKGEIIGKRVTDVVPGVKEDSVDWIGRYGEVAMTEKPAQFESYSQALNRWYAVSAFSPHKGYFAVTFADISERRQAEAELRRQREWFHVTLASIGDAVIATDMKGNITFMNGVAEELTGWTLGETGMKPVSEVFRIVNEHTGLELESPVHKVLREGTIAELANHTVLIRKDGTEVPIDDSGAPIRDLDGRTLGVVLVFRNIAERRKREEESFRLNGTLMALSEVGQAMVRSASETEYLNRVCRIVIDDCGYSMAWIGFAEDDANKTVRPTACAGFEEGYLETLDVTWADTERGRGPTGTAIRIGKPQVCTNMLIDPLFAPWREEALRRGYASSAVFPMMVSGRTLGALTVYSKEIGSFSVDEMNLLAKLADDVTYGLIAIRLREDKARAEEALRKTYDELELRVRERTSELQKAYESLKTEADERRRLEDRLRQAQKMEAIGTLAGGIAHDFNNILGGVIGFTEMMLEDVPPHEPAHRQLKLVLKAGQRGRDLVKQILSFSRQTEQKAKAVAVKGVIEEALNLLRPALPSTIEIRKTIVSVHDTVVADPVQLHQVLMNLCTNAAHAMRGKGGLLEIGLTDASMSEEEAFSYPGMKPGPYLRISVSDTGCGMPPHVMEKIFDPFFTTKGPGEGTGLGLSVVHGIVKNHGGSVTVSSEPDKGTTFHVYLPKTETSAFVEVRVSGSLQGGQERILFIDDEEMLIEMNRQRLEKLGYHVVSSTSGPEALALFRKDPHDFDLVITDYTMPRMTGLDLAKAMIEIRPEIPIILCSGVNEQIGTQYGIKAFIAKTAGKEELAELIRKVLDS